MADAFRTRIYKYELGLGGDGLFRRSGDFWEYMFGEIAKRGFNGVVFYAGAHPFEHILDYETFPEAAEGGAEERAKRREAFNRILEKAHAQGLRTFIQHYIMHFPRALARRVGLDIREGGYARLAGYDLPLIRDYCRYCYREVFRQCPDLDGLYFNFESVGSACDHVIDTAVRECNAMEKRPVFVFRLWGMRDMAGMRRVVEAYKGRSILAHKAADTADVYHAPVADSRAHEWKKAVPGAEYMHIAGPCHNCATNIADQVWADYDYVQTLLADGKAKKVDSLSFHSSVDILAARFEPFDAKTTPFSLYNILHLEAAGDAFRGRTRSEKERGELMAEWLGVSAAAGRALYMAVRETSQAVPLAEEQALVTSNLEGFWLRPRSSLIQNPFIYQPVSELRTSRSRAYRSRGGWVPKEKDFPCGRGDDVQYIIDYVDPSKPVAKRNPKVIASEIKRSSEAAMRWGRKYAKLAGREKGGHLMRFLEINHAVGMWAYHNIMAGIAFYSVYFAKSMGAVIRLLEKGIAELEKARRIEKDPVYHRRIIRVFFFYRRNDLDGEIAAAKRALRLLKRAKPPMKAFSKYLASRVEYNEIMRFFRADYDHGERERRRAAKQLNRAMAPAKESCSMLKGKKEARFAKAVDSWMQFIEEEKAALKAKSMDCGMKGAGAPFVALRHEQCFRWGELYSDDFAEFVEAGDFHRNTDHLSFKVERDGEGLVVTLREEGIEMEQRLKQWEAFKGKGDDRGFLRVFLAADVKALEAKRRGVVTVIQITPKGEGGFMSKGAGATVPIDVEAEFTHDAHSWQTEVRIPFELIGTKPEAGGQWGFNVTSNTAIEFNHQNSWRRLYENEAVNPRTLGRIRFV